MAYDPTAPEVITVSYQGLPPFQIKPLQIGSQCDPKQPLPSSMRAEEPETSRFLNALEKQHKEMEKRRTDAISFGEYRKEVHTNV